MSEFSGLIEKHKSPLKNSSPLALDTYSKCSADCLFCFACNWYSDLDLSNIDPAEIRKNLRSRKFSDFFQIENGKLIYGELFDPFSDIEKERGVTLEMLKVLHEENIPVEFLTRFSWWTEDPRYLDLFKKHKENWNVQMGIMTMDEKIAVKVERGVPTPQERIEGIRNLTSEGISVELNYRSFIPYVCKDWMDVLLAAKSAGADKISLSSIRVKKKPNKRMKEKYDLLNEVTGVDIIRKFNEPEMMGYCTLDQEILRPYLKNIRKFACKIGFSVC